MSKKCFVTTLKGEIENNAIPPYGYIKFELGDGDNTTRAVVRVIEGASLSITSGIFNLYDSAGTTSIATNITSYDFNDVSDALYTVEGKGVFYLANKYDISIGLSINTGQKAVIDLSTINYSKYLKMVLNSSDAILKGVCMINTLVKAEPLNIYIASSQSTGYFDFTGADPAKIEYMSLSAGVTARKGNCVRNLNIALCGQVSPYNLNDTITNGHVNLIDCNTVYGTVESFVENCNATRKGGSIALSLSGTQCTFHGSALNARIVVEFSSSGATVKDVSNNTIGNWNGSTWTYPS